MKVKTSFKKGHIPWHKGKTLSKEHKRKISKSAKKSSVGKWMKGRKLSKETCEKTRRRMLGKNNPLYGKHLTEEHREKLSKAHYGLSAQENHWNWQGGKTSLNHSIRRSLEYRVWRLEVFTRDNFTCQLCNDNTGGNLNPHHKISLSTLIEIYNIKTLSQAKNCLGLWDINNGITLCILCHSKIHNEKNS